MDTGTLYMNTEHGNGLADRRSGTDRRCLQLGLGFPFVDSHGILVTEERRKNGERRSSLEIVSGNGR